MTAEHDVVVVGAGVAGLTAAHELRDLSPLVLDAGPDVGGRTASVELDGVTMNLGAEYWVEAAGHHVGRDLLDDLGIELTARQDDGSGGLVAGGRHVPAHDLVELGAALGLDRTARGELDRTGARIAATVAELWDDPDGPALAASLMARSADDWLGPLDPAVRGFFDDLALVTPGASLDRLHALSFAVLLPAIGGTAGHQWGATSIRGGSGTIANALAARLDLPPRTGAPAVAVAPDGNGATVAYVADGERTTVRARAVVLATPAPVTRTICDLPVWKREALRAVWYASWASVDLVVDVDAAPPWVGGTSTPLLDGPFSLLLNEGIDDAGRLAVRLLVGGDRGEALLDRSPAELDALARWQLLGLLDGRAAVRSSAARSWTAGAPHFRWGSPYGTVANIEALLAPVGALHFCGDYMGFVDATADGGFGTGAERDYRTTTYMATAIRTGHRCAAAVRQQLEDSHR